eukprot:gene1979-2249_t
MDHFNAGLQVFRQDFNIVIRVNVGVIYHEMPTPVGPAQPHTMTDTDLLTVGQQKSIREANKNKIDGHHKFIRWKLVIHGCIDGYSGKIMYLSCNNNNRAETVFDEFKNALDIHGPPSQVRGDPGIENVEVAKYMFLHPKREPDRGSYSSGKVSITNEDASEYGIGPLAIQITITTMLLSMKLKAFFPRKS